MKKAIILLAEGFEEVEALTCIDYLRRAQIDALGVGLNSLSVTGSHGLVVKADLELKDFTDFFDCVIIPGGMPGTVNIANNARALDLIKKAYTEKRLIAAICAAPALVLGKALNLLDNKHFTCYPGMESEVPKGLFSIDKVVKEDNIITSRAAGTAGLFALEIIKTMQGEETYKNLKEALLL